MGCKVGNKVCGPGVRMNKSRRLGAGGHRYIKHCVVQYITLFNLYMQLLSWYLFSFASRIYVYIVTKLKQNWRSVQLDRGQQQVFNSGWGSNVAALSTVPRKFYYFVLWLKAIDYMHYRSRWTLLRSRNCCWAEKCDNIFDAWVTVNLYVCMYGRIYI